MYSVYQYTSNLSSSVVLYFFSSHISCFLCLFDLKKNLSFPQSPTFFTMLSLSLFHIVLVEAQLTTLNGVMFAASVHVHTVRTQQTTERDMRPVDLLSLSQSRDHETNTLGSLQRRGDDILVLNNGWVMRLFSIDSGLPIAIASAAVAFHEITGTVVKIALRILGPGSRGSSDSTETSAGL